MTPRSISATKT